MPRAIASRCPQSLGFTATACDDRKADGCRGHGMLTFDELLRCRPLIHNERTRTWEIHRDLAEFLDERVGPETTALETGAGLSTLVILRTGPGLHISVQPNADEFDAIAEFATAHDTDMRGFRGVAARSQSYLPAAL